MAFVSALLLSRVWIFLLSRGVASAARNAGDVYDFIRGYGAATKPKPHGSVLKGGSLEALLKA